MVCGLSCSDACGILVPGLGIQPASLKLQGRFLTSGTPGKSLYIVVFFFLGNVCSGPSVVVVVQSLSCIQFLATS